MNSFFGPDRRSSNSDRRNPNGDRRGTSAIQADPFVRQGRGAEENEESGIRTAFLTLWEGRFWILGSMAVFLLLGLFAIWTAKPVYQAQALLQLVDKKSASNDPGNARVAKLFDEALAADAEIEILNSNLLLGGVVSALKLDLVAQPKVLPVIGGALLRHNPNPPRITIDTFDLPDGLRGNVFQITALAGGLFRVDAPEEPDASPTERPGQQLALGMPGEPLTGTFNGQTFQLKVASLKAKPGQKFLLSRRNMSAAIDALKLDFDAVEKGRLTNVIGLTCKADSRAKGVDILNEIMRQYVRLKIARRNGDSVNTLAVLQAKMPALKANLEASESRLNQFRSHAGSVDINHEGATLLEQGSSLASQISALRQHRQELLRTYANGADVVVTVDQQLAKLTAEAERVDAKVRQLPQTEQEVVRLSRNVQVDTDLYTALLNNIQQLQITSAGDIGNVSVVDSAMSDPLPVSPKKPLLITLFLFLGFLAGVGLSKLRQVLNPGIEDHRLIETKLGIPVLVTVPHSKPQKGYYAAMRERKEGIHLLSRLDPEDLAVESLRSLRTSLKLTLQSASSNVIMVTGPSPSIGKSFISANLADVFAQTGSRVLVVDGDLRRGGLHRFFGVKSRNGGLSEVLSLRVDWKTLVQSVGREPSANARPIPGLHVLSSGILPSNPSELLMTDRFSSFIGEVAQAYDVVIIDSPPLLSVTDATIIGSKVGAVLMVAKYGQHPMDELRTCQKRLVSHGIRLTGCVFNDIEQIAKGYKYAYHYAYK